MVGAAVTLGVALSTGFDRAQQAAHTPDVTARFDLIERSTADGRISGIANLRSYSFRLVQRSADFRVAHADHGDYRYGRAELNGVEPTSRNDGLAIVAGRGLSGKPGEALIERGLADEWHIGPGREIGMRTDRGTWSGTIVGVTVEFFLNIRHGNADGLLLVAKFR